MKFLTTLAALAFATPVAAFERHELDLGEGKYNAQTNMTAYEVINGICFDSFESHKAYADSKGLDAKSINRISNVAVILVLGNEDDTYREVYLIDNGIGCLKAVGYQGADS